MIHYKFAKSEDISLLENMYRVEIEDNVDRAKRFAEDLVLKYKTIIAVEDKKVCGTVTWEPRGGLDDGVVEMIGLGVNEGFKRQGIATKLVDIMIQYSSQFYTDEGYTLRVILLFMERQNETALKFYSAKGFKEVTTVPSLYPNDDASIWTRHL